MSIDLTFAVSQVCKEAPEREILGRAKLNIKIGAGGRSRRQRFQPTG
jgi:hypothetical protein